MYWTGRRMGAAAAVFDQQGRVLLVRHTYGKLNWELPGGASEPGESIVETALRELREETGLDAVAEQLTGAYYVSEDDGHHFVFRCRLTSAAAPAPASPEISACAYWPPDALPRPISTFTMLRIEDTLTDLPRTLPLSVPPRRWIE